MVGVYVSIQNIHTETVNRKILHIILDIIINVFNNQRELKDIYQQIQRSKIFIHYSSIIL